MPVLLVDNARALESLRNSDFDAYSAFGEVIDNSIQANAKRINIKIIFTPRSGRQFEPIIKIAFADDGHGMEGEILHRCLQLGYSSRYNDRSGIGRFGVGMTLGAINQCERVEVYSKILSGQWSSTYIDLTEIEELSRDEKIADIPEPKKAELPVDLAQFFPKTSGTVVVWSKYDRQPETASEMLKELRIWIGRTYRHFIWGGTDIYVNGDVIHAIDPLYARTEKTAFPDDPKAELFDPIVIDWMVPEEDRLPGGPTSSKITIRLSLLPENFRPLAGSGGSKEARDRLIDRNEGLSIIRNHREVFYGEVPYWPGPKTFFNEIARFWGCEIEFDAVLDKAFTVKNIKRGAVPDRELKKTICDQITPTVNGLVEKVRELWKENAAKAIIETTQKTGIDTGHSVAEEAARKTPAPPNQIDKGKLIDKEADKLAEKISAGADDDAKQRWILKFQSQPFTIVDSDWRGATFIDVHHLGGKDVIQYNMQHIFFQTFRKIRDEIDRGIDVEENAKRMKSLIDLLLISYSKAEAMFEGDQQMSAEQFVEQVKNSWGQYLSNYISTWTKAGD